MAHFTLTVLDGQKAILSTDRALSRDMADRIREQWSSAMQGDGLVIIPECEVIDLRVPGSHVIELDLGDES